MATPREHSESSYRSNSSYKNNEERWRAVEERDPSADGYFVYAVCTTGIYCRPRCPARRALRAHVRFFENAREAALAGYRPCKRCRPEDASPAAVRAALIARACRAIEAAETPPTLAALASDADLSPYHFHRLFKEVTGLTPKRYATAHRAAAIRHELSARPTVTDAIYSAGFNSSSRFYEQSNALLGMTAKEFRAGAPNLDIQIAVGTSSLGAVLVAATEKGICAILLGDDPAELAADLRRRFPKGRISDAEPAFSRQLAEVLAFIEQPQLGLQLPLDIRGTAFQRRVWDALQKIPPGSTTTYSALAAAIGMPNAARAVAGACAANPLAVAVPCHRVVRTDRSLSGYRWGLPRKAALLERESVNRESTEKAAS